MYRRINNFSEALR
jgi:tetratricopeptide (TPR) repeat protein